MDKIIALLPISYHLKITKMTTVLKKSFEVWLMLLCVGYNILSSSKWKKSNPRERIFIIKLKRKTDLIVFYFMFNTKFHLIWFLRNFIYSLNMTDDYLRKKISYDQKSKTWTNFIISKRRRVPPSFQSSILYRLHVFCPLIKPLRSPQLSGDFVFIFPLVADMAKNQIAEGKRNDQNLFKIKNWSHFVGLNQSTQ